MCLNLIIAYIYLPNLLSPRVSPKIEATDERGCFFFDQDERGC